MDICVIGAGYVGLTSSAVLADLGHHVTCVDKNKERIQALNSGESPIFEPGLSELIQKNQNRLTFTDDVGEAIQKNSCIFICVGTPPLPDGSTDLSYVMSVVDDLAANITSKKTVITKSTVPLGTNEMIHRLLLKKGVSPGLFRIVSNPEFLREGSAVHDMFHPDKTVIGLQHGDTTSLEIMKQIYKGIQAPMIVTTLNDAEVIKFTSNAFLATKISFINEVARICDRYQADVTSVAAAIGLDPRIGKHFLQAGVGYGGSCFPKDVSSFIHSAKQRGVETPILEAVQSVNETQLDVYIDKIHSYIGDSLTKKVAVLGIAFKPNTDDTRSSRAVALIQKLDALKFNVMAYDPKAILPTEGLKTAKQAETIADAILDADCLFIATDWPSFKTLDWKKVKTWMKGDLVIDGRNCIDPKEIRKHGLRYIGVGRV
ncbi:MAG TPA: UDP-glucose/GDP-mannose dehydrogenase family protein [Bacillus sp. (in: firmicutes)]|uniref:UDP-glucose dehydrogenase family protein n=1 Tax=Bacillus litorisediminis TaxID=2922713 RepID=UPI001FACBB49|nr:UDP-glucose/GDP-mannose dehydrogenase family protein [Bacillus litorisediminis]HWO77069.1 UDP-glucose/GDP-mannose dehydrogenase family protein [Bacillus sp. (in: firmicutes)]